ncbi:DUF1297 domain-containing protein [Candidatus Daviesbacteria bacterium]|nr:DUF1297 domain-containing protein [Candidatus Daviesbacteria bacterium]
MQKSKIQIKNQKYTIAVLGSHSALDVCRGAKDLGFKTLVVVQKGRDKTYAKYYKTYGELGCVDEVIELDKFSDILSEKIQKELLSKNCIFIPHRSFEVYLNDYNAIEKKFKVPIFGNRFLLRTEERTEKTNQYDLLAKADIKYPKQFNSYQDIDRLVMVKVPERKRGYERAFFVVNSVGQYNIESERLIGERKITRDGLKSAVIEEFILGVQVNLNFFYSSVHKRLELIGTDTRRQTNIEGFLKLPGLYQPQVRENISYEEAGHIAVTMLESLIETAMDIGEKFVKVSQELFPPGVIGPFSLQSFITTGSSKKEFIVFDVSPRMPGSPGIFATPYSGYLYGQNISMGKRVAMEIKEAIEKGKLDKILT